MKSTTSLLTDFVSIQSVSSDPTREAEMTKAVEFLKHSLADLGATVQIVGEKNQLVCGLIAIPRATNTIGVYGHYDVQPEDPVDEWLSDPYILTLRNGKYYGRGVADNKGHIVQNLAAIKSLLDEKKCVSNIVFLLEGEEEVGSAHLSDYLSQITLADLSTVDVWYVTDTGMHDADTPQIYTGLRGLLYTELSITTGTRDLHSGVYGNRVYNAAHLMSELIADLKDSQTGRVNLPGFYENIVYPDEIEYKRLTKIVEEDELTRHESGQFALPPSDHRHPELDEGSRIPRTLLSKILPSCDVHGIEVGYVGPGAKTVIPRQATAKISFRLVPGQKPPEVEQSFRSFLHHLIPKDIKWDLNILSAEPAFVTDIHHEWAVRTTQMLEKVFDHPTIYNRSGGSIPVAGTLQKKYGKPVILTGFTLPDDCIHAPNENFDEGTFWKGIEALKGMYGVQETSNSQALPLRGTSQVRK